MSDSTVALLALVILVILFLLEMPVSFAMFSVGFLGLWIIQGHMQALNVIGSDIWEQLSSYGLSVIPFFILMGNIDNKGVLVSGSVDDVIAATKECLRIAAPGGGYILGSDHSVHDDMPNENILAMIETGKKYGKYPIKID